VLFQCFFQLQDAQTRAELRRFVLWRNFAIDKMSETHGISIIMSSLIQSSDKIVSVLVNDGLVERFKRLIEITGPDERLVSLFASMCSLKGRPSRANQEMCTRKLWMKPRDRYAVGVSFHECPVSAAQRYGPVLDVDGSPVEAGSRMVNSVERDGKHAPSLFLGSGGDASYSPVCIAWAGSENWSVDCCRLWWSASSLGLPVMKKHPIPPDLEVGDSGDNTAVVEYVPIEHVLWVLEPDRLCKSVTGLHWESVEQRETKKVRGGLHFCTVDLFQLFTFHYCPLLVHPDHQSGC
jgi:hypothetical protein